MNTGRQPWVGASPFRANPNVRRRLAFPLPPRARVRWHAALLFAQTRDPLAPNRIRGRTFIAADTRGSAVLPAGSNSVCVHPFQSAFLCVLFTCVPCFCLVTVVSLFPPVVPDSSASAPPDRRADRTAWVGRRQVPVAGAAGALALQVAGLPLGFAVGPCEFNGPRLPGPSINSIVNSSIAPVATAATSTGSGLLLPAPSMPNKPLPALAGAWPGSPFPPCLFCSSVQCQTIRGRRAVARFRASSCRRGCAAPG